MSETAVLEENVCAECGAEVREGTEYCFNCGAPLKTQETVVLQPIEDDVAQVVETPATAEAESTEDAADDAGAIKTAAAIDVKKSKEAKPRPARQRRVRTEPKLVWVEPEARQNNVYIIISVALFLIAALIVFLIGGNR